MLLPTLSFVLSTIVFNVLVCFISLFLDGIHIGVYAAPQPRRNKQSIQSTKTTRKVYSPTGRPEFIFGSKLASKGVKSKHPVILIPGLLSSSLESWSTKSTTTASSPASDNDKKCAQKYFRKRLFAGPDFKSALFDHDCWLKHMLMDAETGLDNGDFKLRAVSGFDASDYVFPGYWIWARMISNLAAIGYDSNSMHLASYDWRLTPTNMQLRDKFFTKLKVMIESAFEIALEINGGDEDAARVLLVCHSMGSLHFYYFMQWVQSDAGGKQDQEWLDKYLYTWVNIAGPLLGAVKPISLLLSGESSTTASVSKPFGIDMLEHVFPRRERQEMFRTWGSFGNLLPKGGDAIWGSVDSPAPDAITLLKTKSDASSTALSTEASPNFGALLEIHQIASSPSNDLESTHPAARARLGVTSSELRNFFKEEHVLVQPFAKTLESQIDSHAATSDNELQENKNNQRSWVKKGI